MKKSALLTFIALSFFFSTSAQDWISIVGKSPYPHGVMVQFTGYNGFEEIDLGSIRTTQGGAIDYFTDFHGRCMISAEGMPSYFLILEHDPICLEWGSQQPFTCDPENEYFYNTSFELDHIDSLFTVYEKADSAGKEMAFQGLDDAIQHLYEEVSLSSVKHARVYMLSELLIRRAKLATNTDQLTLWKSEMLGYAEENYDILSRSDYLGNLAMGYLEMNSTVMNSDISVRQAMEYDVNTWVERLGARAGEREMLDFFMIRFLESGDAGMASLLASKYNDYIRCEQFVSSKLRNTGMPYTFNVFGGDNFSRVYSLDQFSGMPKVLAMVSTDCPASIASVSGLYEFLMEKQIRMPVILVHEVEPEGKLADILSDKAPFSLQTGVKTGGTLMFGAGVVQLPAYMILDRNNLQQQIIYDLEELKQVIGGDD